MGIPAKDVKALRDKTGCGMMDCKEALTEAGGDVDRAVEILRKKGIAKAGKKSARAASEGAVGSYIHAGGKIGVLVEMGCETDFVARNEEFQDLLKEICMQVAASAPLALSPEDLPEDDLEKEKDIYRAQITNKPPEIIEKIVQGKLKAYCKEVCLLEQPWIRDPKVTVKDLIAEKIGKLGENMVVRRFVRYQLGDEA